MNPDIFSPEEQQTLIESTKGIYSSLDQPIGKSDTHNLSAVDRWYEALPGGLENFQSRLELADVELKNLGRHFGTRQPHEHDEKWINVLADLTQSMFLGGEDPHRDSFTGKFHELTTLIAEYGWKQIEWEEHQLLSDSGIRALKGILVNRLEYALSNCLYAWFDAYRKSQPEKSPSDSNTKLYDGYVEHITDGGFKEFCLQYPVAGKQTVVLVSNWIESTREFLHRLEKDANNIQNIATGLNPRGVTNVESVGDPHEGGRETLTVTTETGDKFIYKPRSVGPANGFYDILEWFDNNTELPGTKYPTVIENEGYGWMEWVERNQCASETEVSDFYERAGTLLAILDLCNFIDGNLENFIASGPYPVIIDLETLADPGSNMRPSVNARKHIVDQSILRTAIIPYELNDGDMAGWSKENVELQSRNSISFQNVNTDSMSISFGVSEHIEGKSLPKLDGEIQHPTNYVEDIVAGFQATYQYILSNREELLDDARIAEKLEDLHCRCIYRPTITYMKVIRNLRRPAQLQDGLKFDFSIEDLCEPFLDGTLSEKFWPLFRAEVDTLANFNIPRFTINTSESHIYQERQPVVENVLSKSPVEHIREKIRTIDEETVDEQIDYILAAYNERNFNRERTNKNEPEKISLTELSNIPAEQSQIWALSAADEILSARHRTELSDTVIHRRNYKNTVFQVTEPKPGLYEGRLGVATSLATVGTTTNTTLYCDSARTIASTAVEDRPNNPDEYPLLGAARGLGGDIYALTTLGSLTGNDWYYQQATELITGLTDERIYENAHMDVFRGIAGFVLGATALYEQTGEKAALRKAQCAGERLCDSAIETADGPRWKTMSTEQVYSGYIHGTAGIGYALSRLSSVSEDPQFGEMATNALKDIPVRDSRINLPDVAVEDEPRMLKSWSNGLTGIAMGLLGAYKELESEAIRERLHTTLNELQGTTVTTADGLHEGTAGHVMMLSELHKVPGVEGPAGPEFIIDRRALTPGDDSGRNLQWHTDHWTNTALFNGVAGIAYVNTRIADPTLPNLLLFESSNE